MGIRVFATSTKHWVSHANRVDDTPEMAFFAEGDQHA